MLQEPCRASSRAGLGAGIWVAFMTSVAVAQTQLSLQETSLNVTANHSGNQVVNIHLNSVGPNAAVYGIVGRPSEQRASAPAGRAPRVPVVPAIVHHEGEVNWSAPHAPDELIVCYNQQWLGGIKQSNLAPAMRQQKNALHAGMGATLRKELRLINADVITVPPGMGLEEAARRYALQPGVSFVQPNYVYHAVGLPDDPCFPFVPSSSGPPNDQLLWGLHTTAEDGSPIPPDAVFDMDIDAAEAWEVTTGSSSVVVAVIDTGVDYTHPDIAANMWTNLGEIAGNGIDDDGNGLIDDIHGYDFYNNDGDPMDDHYHGTHVAGTIGAVGNNGLGVAGVNWNVRIMALKFLGATGYGVTADAIDCINYAVLMGAPISNNSWGSIWFDAALRTAIQNAANADHLFVAAAGNSSNNNDVFPFYPCTYDVDEIISVAAWNKTGWLADFSNYGATTVDLAAPGVGIYSLQPGGGIRTLNGTSMASPHVAGVAALLKAVRPDAGPLQLKQWILNGATPHANLTGKVCTGGRLNAVEPLRLATMSWLSVGNREGIIAAGGSRTIPVTFITQNMPAGSYSGSLVVLDLSYDEAVTPRIEIPVSMNLEYVEFPPIVQNLSLNVVRNFNRTVTLLGHDVNPGQSISFTIQTLPVRGTLIDPATSLPISSVPYSLAGGANTVVYSPQADQLYMASFQYTATDGIGTSNVATVTLNVIAGPTAPQDVSSYSGNTYVDLNWLPNVEEGLVGYHVYASSTSGGPYTKVTSAPYTGTTYRHYPSWQAPTYYVITAALDIGGEGEMSAEVTGQPTHASRYAPVNLRGTASNGRVYLKWDAPWEFNGAYRIIRDLQEGGAAEIIWELTTSTQTSYVDGEDDSYSPPPENDVTYTYYIENYSYWDGWGSGSNMITVTPADSTWPSMPTGVQGVCGVVFVVLTWDANPELDIDGYWVFRSTDFSGPYEYQGTVPDRRYFDRAVAPSTTYYYFIAALDLDGEESDWTEPVSATTGTDTTPPAPPTNLTATPGDGVVYLNWDDNAEPDLDVYFIYRATTSGGPYEEVDNDNPSEFSDPYVVNGTTYYYVVTAKDAYGNESGCSNEAYATPHAPGSCTVDAECDDGVYCNGEEVCVAGECQTGTAVDCDDGVPCTVDSCNETTDSCDHIANNAYCDDGSFCNGVESCDVELGCQAGTPVDCNDGVSCTNDSCNETTDSCDHNPVDALCDDGQFCNGEEVCHETLGCQAGADPCDPLLCRESDDMCVECLSASDCDDGLFCNGEETCDAAGNCQPGSDPCPGQDCDEATDACVGGAEVWLTFIDSALVPGVGTVENEDIVAFDLTTGAWSLIFDGSDVGLSGFTIDGMARMPDGSILLSFAEAGSVAGMTGGPSGTTLDDSDIVRFIPTSLGPNTAGSFVFYFDGSDVGLTTDNEDIDAIALTASGQLVISTLGSVSANGANGADTDLLLFNATSLGSVTAGTFSIYFDGSDVGLSDNGSEDVDAVAFHSSGGILLSTLGNVSVPGVTGADEDVLLFMPTQLGSKTSGTYSMYLDLSTLGIATSENVGAIEYKQ